MVEHLEEDNVIDNRERKLSDVLNNVLPEIKSADIAVGYFYISGLKLVIDTLEKCDKTRLLLSQTIDNQTVESLFEIYQDAEEARKKFQELIDAKSKKEREKNVIEDQRIKAKKQLEGSKQTESDQNTINRLKKLIQGGKLEVRVYLGERLHAKAYILKSRDNRWAHGIVGSSNFTYSGLAQNSELNLKTGESSDINKLSDWFENLWKDAKDFEKDWLEIVNACWISETYTQQDIFEKALYHEFKNKLETPPDANEMWKYTIPNLYKFQDVAVSQGLLMFENYGGVILGDVVGLGKTRMGTALLKYLSEYTTLFPLIICPPNLVDMWEESCEEFQVDAKVISMGKLSRSDFKLVEEDGRVKFRRRDLVLIDESHHFRNSGTSLYKNLKQWMEVQDAKAILLSATPYANRPEDIKNQLMLFHARENETKIPDADGDLGLFFQKVKRGTEGKHVSDILRHVMVRRTRRFLIKHWGKKDENGRDYLLEDEEKVYFPKQILEIKKYDINKVYKNNYETIVEFFKAENLKFARYNPAEYLKEEFENDSTYQDLKSKKGMTAGLMKISLLKRLDSSLHAFQLSIKRMTKLHQIFLGLLNKGTIPVGKDSNAELHESLTFSIDVLEKLDELEPLADKITQGQVEKGKLYETKAFHIEDWKNDINRDLEFFKEIQEIIMPLSEKTDDKLKKLQKLLGSLKDKKVLVYSEFADTTHYLNKNITWEKKAEVTSETTNKMKYVEKFDPENNGAVYPKNEQLTLLIATDVLSEGVNLQAGNVVINYDFFWNPVRLIQRMGRIDRIGSKHDTIKIINFLPDDQVEEDLGLKQIVRRKIDEIHREMGMDNPILENDEVINESDQYGMYDPKKFGAFIDRMEEKTEFEPDNFESIITQIKLEDPDRWNKLSKEIPNGIRYSEGDGKNGKLLICCESGNNRFYYKVDKDGVATKMKSSLEALEILKVEEDKPTSKFPENYSELVASGFKQFEYDLGQITAGQDVGYTKSPNQRKIIKRLKVIASKPQNENNNQIQKQISLLIEGYNLKLSAGLTKELTGIIQNDYDDDKFLDKLNIFYNLYKLHKVSENVEDPWLEKPRILYSKYYFEKN